MDLCEYSCKYCGKHFNNRSNVYRHTKNVHKRNSQGEIISDAPRKKFACILCDKQYLAKQNLELHMSNVHFHKVNDKSYSCGTCDFKSKYQSNLIRHNKIFHNGSKSQSKHIEASVRHYKCTECMASFEKLKHLSYHRRIKHNLGKSSVDFKRKCPLCPYVSVGQSPKDIYHHFETFHSIHIKFEHHTFNSANEFDAWRNEIEKKTVTSFKKKNTYSNQYKSKSIHTYQCHRSGVYKPVGLNKRRIRMSGSCKINGYCPSSIKATFKDSKIDVIYVPCHVGHSQNLKYIKLTKEERRSIATQLVSGKPHEVIIKWIRSSISNSVLNRFHLINNKDIRNIETSINEEAIIKHSYDPVSIESWVSELRGLENTALIMYKPEGTESPELNLNMNDFLLIFMNQTQKKMLQTYGYDCICIDGTHWVNRYNFQLYSILVLDDSREGFPVSFMLTNRRDEHAMKIFFNSVKNVVGSMKVKVFMSDMEESFYAAWLQTMGPADMRVFCTWHVLNAWKANVFSKIKYKAKQMEILKTLKTLLYEIDKTAFHNLLEKTIERFHNDEDLKEFSKYFETYYKTRYTTWAYCYRTNAGVHTNMSIENFNTMLKYCYTKEGSIHNLDNTLCAILSLLKDKLFDILIKITRGKLVTKLRNLRTAHRRSLAIKSDHITKNEDKWRVLSSTQNYFYTVQKIKNCKSCQLQCLHCESCFHEFVCSCLENAIRNNMCKHIHAVAKHLKMVYDKTEMYSTLTENKLVDEEILKDFVKDASTVERVEFLEELKIKCGTDLQEFLNIITNTDDIDIIKYGINEIKRMRTTVEAMQPATPPRTCD